MQAEEAEQAAEVDALVADVNELRSVLEGLEAEVAAKEALAAEAQLRAGFADDQVTLSRLDAARAADEERDLRGPGPRPRRRGLRGARRRRRHGGALVAGDWLEGSRRAVVLDVVTDRDRDLVDRFRVVAEELADRQHAARAAEIEAEEAAAAAVEAVAAAAAARDEQAGFVAEVEARLDHALAEAASLEAIDAELAAEIRAKEGQIADLVREAAEAKAAAEASRCGSGGGPRLRSAPAAQPAGLGRHRERRGHLRALVHRPERVEPARRRCCRRHLPGRGRVAQLRVADQVAPSRTAGHRSTPSGAPPRRRAGHPTARPGQSNHERGLAIDFTYAGRAINSRRSPAYQWLSANAASYGLYNLPSEPWHWSVNGQ